MVDNEEITDQFIQNIKRTPNKVHHLTGVICLSVSLATRTTKVIHYRVVVVPIPRTLVRLIPRLCPLIFSELLFPSDGASGPTALLPFPPSQILSDSLSPAVHSFPLVFLCLLSVRVILSPPPLPSSV